MKKKKVAAIVQDRMGSIRFPGKVMQEFSSRPLIEILLRRLRNFRLLDEIVIATSRRPENDSLVDFVDG